MLLYVPDLLFCLLSFYPSTCIVYSSVCVPVCYLCLCLSVCVIFLCMCVYVLFLCVCVCIVFVCVLVCAHAWRRLSLLCACYQCVSVHLLCYIIMLYSIRPLIVCPLLVSQTVYRSLSLYCTKVSAHAGRRLACSLFSECTALTC